MEKDKFSKLKDQYRTLDKSSLIQHERGVRQEETIRELKLALKSKKGLQDKLPPRADDRTMDLHRALDLYNKASEKEQKVIQMQKKLQNKTMPKNHL